MHKNQKSSAVSFRIALGGQTTMWRIPSVSFGCLSLLAVAATCGVTAGCGTHQIEGLGSPVDQGAGGIGVNPGGPDAGTVSCTDPSGAGAMNGGLKSGIPSVSAPAFDGIVSAVEPPPPISGGTLLVLRDGVTAVAADSDRDRLYVVDVSVTANPKLVASIPLLSHDEPGRLIQDGAGMVHVVLRNAGALATLDPTLGKITMRRSTCQVPRGLAYDPVADRLLVACAGGELLTFAPKSATPERSIQVDSDLRDVVLDGPRVMLSRFRSADLIVLNADGTILDRIRPTAYANQAVHGGSPFGPAVAWRTVGMPDGGAMMVHQRGMNGTVGASPGGYGGLSSCDSIVHTSVTRMRWDERPVAGPAMPAFVLPVDLAISPDGGRLAMVAAGNGHALNATRRLFVANVDDVSKEWNGGCGEDDRHGPASSPACSRGPEPPASDGSCVMGLINCGGKCVDPNAVKCDAAGPSSGAGAADGNSAGGVGGSTGSGGASAPGSSGTAPTSASAPVSSPGAGGASGDAVAGVGVSIPASCGVDLPTGVEPVAVAYAGPSLVLVQSREPAQLWLVKENAGVTALLSTLTLSQESRADTGHAVFHSNSGGGLACASCHPEGHEDGRVWDFQCEGLRRTQDISGGLSGTEPFHWSGDLPDFPKLMDTVFVGRMSGPSLSRDQASAALKWINTVPSKAPLRGASDAQAQRGKTLFNSASVGCATCHAGKLLTNNTTVDVGTSEAFQVPSLRGVGWRAPYMHDGCAPTLAARFGNKFCDGGDAHGKTSQLSRGDLDDLVAFLETL